MASLIRRVLAVLAVVAVLFLAAAAPADAKIAGDPAGVEPQAWMIIGGLATVPIALIALVALFRDLCDDATRDANKDEQREPDAQPLTRV